jgi:hypothetical protein
VHGDEEAILGDDENADLSKSISRKCILVLGSCLPIAGADVFSFENEQDLLLAWAE